uniref:Kunitz inhibitor 7 n=1 Tax=Micrurus fulvius TaxID=8637 RepID=U3F5B9_MICFL
MSSGGLLLLLVLHTFWAELTPVSGLRGPKYCYLPADPGPCRRYITAYYYNPSTHSCLQFVYGGCEGNENNFKTGHECHRACVR